MADTTNATQWGELAEGRLKNALEKLYSAEFDNYETIDKIVSLQEEVEPLQKQFFERKKKLYESILPKNEEGQTYLQMGTPEAIKYQEEHSKLFESTVEIKTKKILVDKKQATDAGLKLNANDIRALRGIFEIRKSK